jgi:hypothetical protein
MSLKRVVRKAIAAFNEGDTAAYFTHHTEDTRVLESKNSGWESHEAYRARVEEFLATHRSAHVTINRLVEEGNTVVMESLFAVDSAENPRPEVVVFDFVNEQIATTTVYSNQGTILT